MKRLFLLGKALLITTILLGISCSETTKKEVPWIVLFDGETLNGWQQMGGKATYAIKNGAIVGTTLHNTPNSFLTTSKTYGDFILELSFMVDTTMNSGIQIRSNSLPDYREGVVHGYQIEIDPSDRAWSGGIYDEQRRGWLNPMTENAAAQKAFKKNDWNQYRIEAIGDTLKTWVNGVAAAHLIDDKTASGFIALQVHSISPDMKEGTEIIWKDIKIITDSISKYTMKSTIKPIITMNQLTIDEQKND